MGDRTYYGDQTRWFLGRVISIQDPLQLGRVKVRIHGIHSPDIEDISEFDLPWAHVSIPVTEGGTSGLGTNVGIKESSQVFGIFLDGEESQIPFVLGSIPKIESGLSQANQAWASRYSDQAARYANDASLANLDGTTNVEKAFNYFLSPEGGEFSIEQACGIIGNLLVESGKGTQRDIDPMALNRAEGSFGIAQWNPAAAAGYRLAKLKEWCNLNTLNHQELSPQLQFIKYELFTYTYLGLSKLRNTDSIEDASLIFEKYYERPAPGSSNSRINYAVEVFEKMTAQDERIILNTTTTVV